MHTRTRTHARTVTHSRPPVSRPPLLLPAHQRVIVRVTMRFKLTMHVTMHVSTGKRVIVCVTKCVCPA